MSRIGTWLMILGFAVAIGMVIAAAVRRRLPRPETALLATAAIHLALFTSLLAVKTMSYMALWPLGALMLAWVVATAWRGANRAVQAALVMAFAAMILDGAGGMAASRRSAARVSAYSFYTSQIAGCIPPGAPVLGLQHYWMGLRQFEYRTWLLPIWCVRFVIKPTGRCSSIASNRT